MIENITLIPYCEDVLLNTFLLWKGQDCESLTLIFRYNAGEITILQKGEEGRPNMFLQVFDIGGRPRKKASQIIRWLQERNYRQIYMGQLRRMLEKAQRGLLENGFQDDDIVVRVFKPKGGSR